MKNLLRKTSILMLSLCMCSPVVVSTFPTTSVEAADKNIENAYRQAKMYLQTMPFSKKGLIDQLSSNFGGKFTVEQAKAAVNMLEDNKEVNWKKQAVKAGKQYLDMMGMSRQGLIDQLSSDYGSKFTVKQATYAADKLGL